MLFATAEDLERKKRAQATGVVDDRTTQQAVESLLTPPSAAVMPSAPMSPTRQAHERYGNGEAILRRMGNLLTGGLFDEQIIPEMSDGNRLHYKNAMELYQEDVLAMHERAREQSRMLVNAATLGDGVETPQDMLARADMVSSTGSIENAQYAMTGELPGLKPEMITVENNGQKYMVDKNNPTAPGIPLTMQNGQPIRGKLDQWQVDNVGAFDRMAPRLIELDEMENAGMAIPRSTMTMLRAYETQDGDGRNVLLAGAMGEWMSKYLTPEQRKYILAAEDAGMVVLRDESGAAISSSEILRQMNQYLMFDDLDGPTRKAQREARSRKAGTLMTGMPDYILNNEKRAGQIQWLNDYDGTVPTAPDIPQRTGGGGKLPPMTAQEMAVYLNYSKTNQADAERFLELLRLRDGAQ